MDEKMTANLKGFGKTQQNLFDWISVGSYYMTAVEYKEYNYKTNTWKDSEVNSGLGGCQ